MPGIYGLCKAAPLVKPPPPSVLDATASIITVIVVPGSQYGHSTVYLKKTLN